MQPTIQNFLDLLESQVGRGIYVWGGNGENLLQMNDPATWIERRETSAENVEKDLALYEKRKAAGIDPIRAFDCSGLVYWALKQLGAIEHDLSLCNNDYETYLTNGYVQRYKTDNIKK